MYIEVDKNNYVLGYSDKPSGTSIETQQNIPSFTDIQKLKFENNVFVVEDSNELSDLVLTEPMRLLRQERNRRLQETDWTQYRDVSLSNDSDWQTYRQSLRDLPQNFSPIIDIITEDGYPIVKEQTDWPEKPS